AYDWLPQALQTIHKANWYRQTKLITGIPDNKVTVNGQSLINFASNNYLGLAGDKRIINAAITAIKNYGTGSTGSRLTSGHLKLHQDLEVVLASWKQTEEALVFSSGYLANLGTITALVTQKDLILADQYNHSSLKNGARLSGAKVINYTHCDLSDVKRKLQLYRDKYRRCLILTDSVFSMDGDICPLPELISLATEYECMLLIDEAHGIGVLGEKGTGCVEYFGCQAAELIQIGTLSKALGSLGGYVAGSKDLIDFLRNRAATWIYTTGLSPGDTAAALTAIDIVQQEPAIRAKLWQNINRLKSGLSQINNLEQLPSESAVICWKLKSSASALNMAQKLKQAGIYAPAIRPPTVPTSRIRFSVMSSHKPEQIDYLL
ncbi:MAG: 8-amino-7-oxononanoate synthase, partial [Cyanobacteria bacterium J083]